MNAKIWEKTICVKKYYVWNTSTCTCENGKYLENIISVVMCDEIIEVRISIPTNFNEK